MHALSGVSSRGCCRDRNMTRIEAIPGSAARPSPVSRDEIRPPSAAERSAIIDRAYDDFCERVERGESPDPDEFCAQFPGVHSSLYRLLEAHRFFDENPQLLAACGAADFPEAGQTILGFRLVRELGRGSFA